MSDNIIIIIPYLIEPKPHAASNSIWHPLKHNKAASKFLQILY
jgi:hypothetical protein